MPPIEFNSYATEGIIKIPDNYKNWYNKPITVILRRQETTLSAVEQATNTTVSRPIGLAKNKFQVSPHLFNEHPEDLLDAFQDKDDKALASPEYHRFCQLLPQIMSYSVQLTPYAPYIKEVFRYVSAHDDIDTVISLTVAIEASSLIISLPEIEKYHLSIYVLEDSGLVLDFFLDPARVTCVVREQSAHTMWMQDDEVNQHVLQGADFSILKISTHLKQIFKVLNEREA